jgi:SAM-dependent methyltransferase
VSRDSHEEHEFDRYHETYRDEVQRAIGFSGIDVDFFTEAKAEVLLDILRGVGDPTRLNLLDVGCGPGLMHRFLAGKVARLTGTDVSEEMLEAARAANPGVEYVPDVGGKLPFDDGTFDVVFASCVLHHVEKQERPSFARELARVLEPRGLAVVFEHNPLNPLTRLGVARCAFDQDVELLRPREVTGLLRGVGLVGTMSRYIIFLPIRGALTRALERRLKRVALGAQYVVVARR